MLTFLALSDNVCLIEYVFKRRKLIQIKVIKNYITIVQSVKKQKKKNTPINFNTNYRREMKLIPIDLDYCLF